MRYYYIHSGSWYNYDYQVTNIFHLEIISNDMFWVFGFRIIKLTQ